MKVQSTDGKVGNIENVLNDSTDPVVVTYESITVVNTLASLKKCQLTRGLGRARRVTPKSTIFQSTYC